MTFFTVIENQALSDGTFATLHNHYTDKNQALSAFFAVCAAAAVSEIPYHAAYLIDSKFGCIEQRVWDRREQE